MGFDFFGSTGSSGPRNQFGRTASEDANKVAEFEQSARDTIRQCGGNKDAIMKNYMVNQSMRTLLDPNDAILNEAYAARSRIYKTELLRQGVEESWFTQWEDIDQLR